MIKYSLRKNYCKVDGIQSINVFDIQPYHKLDCLRTLLSFSFAILAPLPLISFYIARNVVCFVCDCAGKRAACWGDCEGALVSPRTVRIFIWMFTCGSNTRPHLNEWTHKGDYKIHSKIKWVLHFRISCIVQCNYGGCIYAISVEHVRKTGNCPLKFSYKFKNPTDIKFKASGFIIQQQSKQSKQIRLRI